MPRSPEGGVRATRVSTEPRPQKRPGLWRNCRGYRGHSRTRGYGIGGLRPQILFGTIRLDLPVHEESADGDQCEQEKLLHRATSSFLDLGDFWRPTIHSKRYRSVTCVPPPTDASSAVVRADWAPAATCTPAAPRPSPAPGHSCTLGGIARTPHDLLSPSFPVFALPIPFHYFRSSSAIQVLFIRRSPHQERRSHTAATVYTT